MHLPNFLPTLLLLFPLSVAAVASHDPAASAEINTNKLEAEPRAISRPQHCAIVGSSSTVNCRSGPGTKYDVRVKLARGRAYDFWCVYSKECVTIGGKRNCGWHYLKELKCFVNGHYTDDNCTLARLGGCDNCDDDCNAPSFRGSV